MAAFGRVGLPKTLYFQVAVGKSLGQKSMIIDPKNWDPYGSGVGQKCKRKVQEECPIFDEQGLLSANKPSATAHFSHLCQAIGCV